MDDFLQNHGPWQGKKVCESFCKQNYVMAVMLHMVGIFAKCLENYVLSFFFQGRKQVFLSAWVLDMLFVITFINIKLLFDSIALTV